MTLLIIMVVVLVVLTCTLRSGGFILGLWLAGAVGWVANIAALLEAPAEALWGALEIMRVVGIVLGPLGAVLGYF